MNIPKFWAWDIEKKIMCDVFNIQFDLGYVGIRAENYCVFERDIKKVELLQDIGMKKINGEPIKKGDIFKHNENTYCIIWQDKYLFKYIAEDVNNPKNWRSIGWLFNVGKHVKWIGNKYSNPELLEDAK